MSRSYYDVIVGSLSVDYANTADDIYRLYILYTRLLVLLAKEES